MNNRWESLDKLFVFDVSDNNYIFYTDKNGIVSGSFIIKNNELIIDNCVIINKDNIRIYLIGKISLNGNVMHIKLKNYINNDILFIELFKKIK